MNTELHIKAKNTVKALDNFVTLSRKSSDGSDLDFESVRETAGVALAELLYFLAEIEVVP